MRHHLPGLVMLIIGGLTLASADLNAEPPTLESISAELRRQDQAWDDLEIRYDFESDFLSDDGKDWVAQPVLQMTWKLTQSGWQRVRREREADSGRWIEQASFDGEFYMMSDSQGAGSGAVGHQGVSFLYNSNVPRLFGLYVTGQELGQPISVSEFLVSSTARTQILSAEELIVVRGDDPLAEGDVIELELDPETGFRPRQMSITDKKGPLSIYTELKYRRLTGARGDFWFPESGLWRGYRPQNREEMSRLRYRAREILVDQKPVRDEFVLTYPAGALMLNTDTGETIYLKTETTPSDVPEFAGKRISLAEHDREAQRTKPPPARPRSIWSFVLNFAGIALIAIVVLRGLWSRTPKET